LGVLSLLRLWEWQGCTLSRRYRSNPIDIALANYIKALNDFASLAESVSAMSDPSDSIQLFNRKEKNVQSPKSPKTH
jgi:hypothetical protein